MPASPISFTFDLEDHRPSRDAWPARFPEYTRRMLDWMDDHGIRATVFAVGEVAADHPDLVREVAARGHEIGLHNWQHLQLFLQTPAEFEAGIRRGKAVLEDITGVEVLGFRAPTGSMTRATSWSLEILAEAGFGYSSSVCPAPNPINGFPGAPRVPFMWSCGMAEFPAPLIGSGRFNLPYLGGTTIRLLPTPLLQVCNRLTPDTGNTILYCHPYDFDEDEPFWWVEDVGRLAPLLWVGRRGMWRKLDRLVAGGTAPPLGEQLDLARAGGVFDPASVAA